MNLEPFLSALRQIPRGYGYGTYDGHRWGTTFTEAQDGHRYKLFAEELGGSDIVSFNVYLTGDGAPQLRPCEMPAAKVIDFVLGYVPEQ